MSLHGFAYSLPRKVDFEINFTQCRQEPRKCFFEWHNNHEIHRWMAGCYDEKGGLCEEFLGYTLVLTETDLDALEFAIQTDFEYATEYAHDVELERNRDLNFIKLARAEIVAGNTVYYDSW